MSISCPGRSFVSTMFGIVDLGGLFANTSACSPCGSHFRWEERTSWFMYSWSGWVASFGTFSFWEQTIWRRKTIVFRSVAWSSGSSRKEYVNPGDTRSIWTKRCTFFQFQKCGIDVEWYEAKPLCQYLIMSNGSIVPDVNIFYAYSRNLKNILKKHGIG